MNVLDFLQTLCVILSFLKRVKVMDIVERLRQFMEDEARSCSMDPGCITPLYVYRMWGGSVAMDEIATGLTEIRKRGFKELGYDKIASFEWLRNPYRTKIE